MMAPNGTEAVGAQTVHEHRDAHRDDRGDIEARWTVPIVVMSVPVTSGRKYRNNRLNIGAMAIANTPDTMTAPYTAGNPAPVEAIAMIGPTDAKVTPMTTGSRIPKPPTPMHCGSVARPHANRTRAGPPHRRVADPAAGKPVHAGRSASPILTF